MHLSFPSLNPKKSQAKKTTDDEPSIKSIFLCSPRNPTLISLASMKAIQLRTIFKGIVVEDEVYIQASQPGRSVASLVAEYANICVVQMLSKSFGLAAILCISPFA